VLDLYVCGVIDYITLPSVLCGGCKVSMALQADGVTSSLVLPMILKLAKSLRADVDVKRSVPPSNPGKVAMTTTVREEHMPQVSAPTHLPNCDLCPA
jgi:hypothetical protein